MAHKIGHFDWFKGNSGAFDATPGGPNEGYTGGPEVIPDYQFGSSTGPMIDWRQDLLLNGPAGGFDLGSLIPGAEGMKGIGAGIQGLGRLAQGWAALKNVKLGRDAFNFQRDFAKDNRANQITTVNNRLRDRNMFKQQTMKPGGYQLDQLLPVESKYLG